MIKTYAMAVALGSAALTAAPAHATLVSYTTSGTNHAADVGIGNSALGGFGDTGIAPGAFTDTLKFTTGVTGETSAVISIAAFAKYFTTFTATLNGLALTATTVPGAKIFSIDIGSLAAGTQTLVIGGTAKIGAGYTGSVSAPVPEPSTWALSILGFGLIGAMLRGRRRSVGTLATA